MTTARVWEKLPETPTKKPDKRNTWPYIERRWINAPYDGPERRRNRQGSQSKTPPLASGWKPLVPEQEAPPEPSPAEEEVASLWVRLPVNQK